jgi:cold shock CspA family protein
MSTTETQTQKEEMKEEVKEVVEPEPETDRMVGQVKWFNNKAGYGFITMKGVDTEEKDIFAHYSTINVADSQSQYRYLVQGEYVEFDLSTSSKPPHEYQSSNISGIKGGKLMCETRQVNRPVKREYEPRVSVPSTTGPRSTIPRTEENNNNNNNNRKRAPGPPRNKENRSNPNPTPTYKDAVDKEGFQVVRKRRV